VGLNGWIDRPGERRDSSVRDDVNWGFVKKVDMHRPNVSPSQPLIKGGQPDIEVYQLPEKHHVVPSRLT
jgi:hypothetical protein